MASGLPSVRGKVFLLGAGPGDPGLLTLRALEALQQADVVLYDYLVNPVALRHARPDAEVICLGKHGKAGGSRIWTQEEINARLIADAKAGKKVARLKSGDPTVFGRLNEELSALQEAGIDYEVTPGVTAGLAAGAFAGIPVTHREFASAVALITGQETKSKTESNLDYEALARFPGTLVFYMGVTTVKIWAPKLIEAGKPADTPVAIIRRCSFPDQLTITTTLGKAAEVLTPSERIRPPVIVIVGDVVRQRETLSWFESRPLFGKRVLMTRPEESGGELTRLLEERGADVIVHPVIEIGPPEDAEPLNAALERLGDYQWVLFSSANGVRGFFDALYASGRDARALGAARVAAVGPGTAEAMLKYGVRCDVTPKENFRAEGLVAALADEARGQRCLSIRGSRGREVLAEGLRGVGAVVDEVAAYASTDRKDVDPHVAQRMAAGEIDWTFATSSAIAHSLVRLFGDALKQTKIASLSPLTSSALREHGFPPAVEAPQATLAALVEAILNK